MFPGNYEISPFRQYGEFGGPTFSPSPLVTTAIPYKRFTLYVYIYIYIYIIGTYRERRCKRGGIIRRTAIILKKLLLPRGVSEAFLLIGRARVNYTNVYVARTLTVGTGGRVPGPAALLPPISDRKFIRTPFVRRWRNTIYLMITYQRGACSGQKKLWDFVVLFFF